MSIEQQSIMLANLVSGAISADLRVIVSNILVANEMSVKLIQPVAMDEGLRFAIREGGRTVGAGRVTKINK